ncbi:MAG TPA: hypothetical protein VF365_02410 [Candidatus Limnocylindria bacterium]
MSTDRETTRIVRSWLEDGVTQLPDSVLDAVLDELPSTHQRRATWWPARRLFHMNKALAYGVVAATVVIVAILGISLLAPTGPSVGDQAESTTATPIPTRPRTAPTGGLEPGTYRVAEFTLRAFTITVPSGWSREDNFLSTGTGTVETDAFEGDSVYLATWPVSHVYSDSCQWEGSLREARSLAELTEALAEQTGHDTTGPEETQLGGYPATRFEFSVPSDFDISACDQEFLRLWPDAGPNENFGLPITVGQTATVYVVDLDGQGQLVIAGQKESSSAADVAALESVVSSISFEP